VNERSAPLHNTPHHHSRHTVLPAHHHSFYSKHGANLVINLLDSGHLAFFWQDTVVRVGGRWGGEGGLFNHGVLHPDVVTLHRMLFKIVNPQFLYQRCYSNSHASPHKSTAPVEITILLPLLSCWCSCKVLTSHVQAWHAHGTHGVARRQWRAPDGHCARGSLDPRG